MTKLIIAIDGPAGAGKGTVCKAIAEELNLDYMDTGALYRAVAYSMTKDGIDIDNKEKAIEYAKMLGNEISFSILKDSEIRTSDAGVNASKVARIPEVRKALVNCQVDFANNPPKDKDGSILDGRDIGTVICPDADVKIFVTASAEVRAERRYKEVSEKGESISYETILQEVLDRDERDQNRSESPLVPAEDAIILDTSDLNIEEACQKAISIVSKANI